MLPLALAELHKAVKLGGNDAGLFDDLGAVLEHAGRLDQAIVAYTRGHRSSAPRLREAADQARLGLRAIEPAREGVGRLRRRGPGRPRERRGPHRARLRPGPPQAPPRRPARGRPGLAARGRRLPRPAQRRLHLRRPLADATDGQATAYQDVAIALLRRSVKLWKKAATGPNELDLIKAEPAFKPIQGRKDFQELLKDGDTTRSRRLTILPSLTKGGSGGSSPSCGCTGRTPQPPPFCKGGV